MMGSAALAGSKIFKAVQHGPQPAIIHYTVSTAALPTDPCDEDVVSRKDLQFFMLLICVSVPAQLTRIQGKLLFLYQFCHKQLYGYSIEIWLAAERKIFLNKEKI
jgi:hypothetical protein